MGGDRAANRYDDDSIRWWCELQDESCAGHRAAMARMYDYLFRSTRRELYRGGSSYNDKELDDIANQVAADALVALLAKLPTFRGDCKLTTWAYRFVVLELSHKLKTRRRHAWTRRLQLHPDDWSALTDPLVHNPSRHAEAREMIRAVGRAFAGTDRAAAARVRRDRSRGRGPGGRR
ncbi:hypothetical protein [Mycolicibacterium parafortuitum]|uniref:Sigma-70 factor [Nocardioides sp. JS614] n=1 Tax=Mycolicibacterium parafortuitum TaxID=39692 RepID=A0A375YEB0_MYCPF|nr:hypothetical protein [Mycolicibacterium parafortuitum]ORB30225.1 hypothetical protein BST38_12175 [Mycolicibacterium parafortuitum]SRX79441.1 sigma-70 factor [Nocardioides sp. JS614] [Mycolicibacterium parafortuitum]